MRKIFVFLLLLPFIVLNGQMIAKDKQLHIGAGAVVSAWGSMIPQDNTGWKPFIYGVGAATIAGAGKELADLGGLGTPDLKDLGATILGGIISVGIITGVKAIIKKTPIVRRKRLHAQRRKVLYTQQQFSLQ